MFPQKKVPTLMDVNKFFLESDELAIDIDGEIEEDGGDLDCDDSDDDVEF